MQREQIIRYLDGSLGGDEKTEVELLIENDRNASRDLQEIHELIGMISEHGTLFCPDPLEISDFLETGKDLGGTVSEHLRTCTSCQHDVDLLRARRPGDTMPRELLRAVHDELARDGIGKSAVQKERRWSALIREKVVSFFSAAFPGRGCGCHGVLGLDCSVSSRYHTPVYRVKLRDLESCRERPSSRFVQYFTCSQTLCRDYSAV